MSYVDGVVCGVPDANREACVDFARRTGALFKRYGAIAVVDCWGDDVPEGQLTSFTMAVKREAHESVVFSWVMSPSREARDAGWKTVMDDPLMNPEQHPLPFDGKRMIYGGFQTIVES